MKYHRIPSELFTYNRKAFTKELKKNSLAVICSNDQMPTNADGTMPFKQNSDLFWLCGVDQEESRLLLCKDKNDEVKEYLFLKKTSELILGH